MDVSLRRTNVQRVAAVRRQDLGAQLICPGCQEFQITSGTEAFLRCSSMKFRGEVRSSRVRGWIASAMAHQEMHCVDATPFWDDGGCFRKTKRVHGVHGRQVAPVTHHIESHVCAICGIGPRQGKCVFNLGERDGSDNGRRFSTS